jgi:hypothetical protein
MERTNKTGENKKVRKIHAVLIKKAETRKEVKTELFGSLSEVRSDRGQC